MSFCPICHSVIGTWTDDPILTSRGLAGEDYKGLVGINWRHIKEIQDVRKSQETTAGITPTTFSAITPTIPIHKNHILELRQSTERLITNIESSLTRYFNYKIEDYEEVYVGTYKYGEKVVDKTNWTDPNLVNTKKIKAIHIEELRHSVPSLLYDMQSSLEIIPDGLSINRACYSFPYTTEIKAYWGEIDVTEKAYYEVKTGDIEIIKSSGKVYIKANGTGSVSVSFIPPGFWNFASSECSRIDEEEEMQEQECIDNYMSKTVKTFTVSSYYYLSYSGELKGGGLLEHFPEHSGGLYGSATPLQCGSLAFSWDDQTSLTYGINAHWKCDFLNRADLTRQKYETCFTAQGMSFMPVYTYPYGDPCPNPNGITSGKFKEWMYANNRNIEVCFEGEEGYWFDFGWSKTVIGDWYYEHVTEPEEEWQLRVNRSGVEGTPNWWAGFRQYF